MNEVLRRKSVPNKKMLKLKKQKKIPFTIFLVISKEQKSMHFIQIVFIILTMYFAEKHRFLLMIFRSKSLILF